MLFSISLCELLKKGVRSKVFWCPNSIILLQSMMFLYIFRISFVDHEVDPPSFTSLCFFENSICFLSHLRFPSLVLLVDLLIKYRSIMILQQNKKYRHEFLIRKIYRTLNWNANYDFWCSVILKNACIYLLSMNVSHNVFRFWTSISGSWILWNVEMTLIEIQQRCTSIWSEAFTEQSQH